VKNHYGLQLHTSTVTFEGDAVERMGVVELITDFKDGLDFS
jgi:hypothetical protein